MLILKIVSAHKTNYLQVHIYYRFFNKIYISESLYKNKIF